jgi:hypothetical protein
MITLSSFFLGFYRTIVLTFCASAMYSDFGHSEFGMSFPSFVVAIIIGGMSIIQSSEPKTTEMIITCCCNIVYRSILITLVYVGFKSQFQSADCINIVEVFACICFSIFTEIQKFFK